MVKNINLGIIGLSEGNGHPYSFSAIINGFDKESMKNSGWGVIYDYLIERKESEFGFDGVKVTHVWTQDIGESERLSKASKIPNIVKKLDDVADQVDGVILARDDYENHYEMSKIFLKKNKYVFIDKPLSINVEELKFFKPYLKCGKLMSCSGVRYAKELDELRDNISEFGDIKLVRGAVMNNLEKYGVHMLDGIFSIINFKIRSINYIPSNHDSIIIHNADKSIIQVDALKETAKTYQFDFWSDKKRFHAEIRDNFSMFKRALWNFIEMIRTDKPQIDPDAVVKIMKILIAANISKKYRREVQLDEIRI